MRDFIGLCVHTVNFKPDLYAPVTRMVRDYHPFDWDVGQETDFVPTFPFARNRVDWGTMYGNWVKAGYKIEVSLMFDNFDQKKWRDLPRDAEAYGRAFASFFGPSNKALVEAIEIGNEPGKYDDATYRTLYESMARGIRAGDPKMRIATCAANLGKSGRYSKSVDLLKGIEDLCDIINIHNYPEIQGYPTWARSYPEDPKIKFLQDIGHVLKWRDQNAGGKEVWLTEFGYDASTKLPSPGNEFAKWQGSTERQQALWTVRGFLVLAATGLDRAYLYFFNDKDEPQVHGSSGLTRNFQPKPAFHAVAHLQKSLGEYRFTKAHRESAEEGYLYEFTHGTEAQRKVLVAWKPTGPARYLALQLGGQKLERAERTPVLAGVVEQVELQPNAKGDVTAEVGETPLFLWLQP